jgi:oleate hydratase
VIPPQPHFAGQPKDVKVALALYVNKPGNFVNKPMEECSDREIFTEFLGHLHVPEVEQTKILEKSTAILCMMRFPGHRCLPHDL